MLNCKSNILLLGPTGTGKNAACSTCSFFLGFRLLLLMQQLLPRLAALVNVEENILLKLITAADGDVERAQVGIVCR